MGFKRVLVTYGGNWLGFLGWLGLHFPRLKLDSGSPYPTFKDKFEEMHVHLNTFDICSSHNGTYNHLHFDLKYRSEDYSSPRNLLVWGYTHRTIGELCSLWEWRSFCCLLFGCSAMRRVRLVKGWPAEAWHRLSRISCCSLRGRTLLSSVRASSPQKGYQAGKWELSSLGIFSQPLVNKNLVKWSLTAVLHHAFPLGTQWALLASVSCITQVRKESRPSLEILRCIGPHQRDTGNSKAGILRHWQRRV